MRRSVNWFVMLSLPVVAAGSGKPTEAASPVERSSQTVITNSIGMRLVLIPAGEFTMGSPGSDKDVPIDEKPQHRVRITRPFFLGAYEVTVGQFRQFVKETGRKTEDIPTKGGLVSWNNPGWQQTDEHPAVWVNWHEAVAFCGWLSRKEGKTYRLPAEAEWEYACRAGSASRYTFGDDARELGEYAWFSPNSRGSPQPVGQKKPNAWGVFDMHGNVWEWCADWYGKEYYATSPLDDPTGPATGDLRVLRGNSWDYMPGLTRSAARGRSRPDHHNGISGFRLARDRYSNSRSMDRGQPKPQEPVPVFIPVLEITCDVEDRLLPFVAFQVVDQVCEDFVPLQQFFGNDHLDAQLGQVRAQFLPLRIVSKVERLGPTAGLFHERALHGIGQELRKVVHIPAVLQDLLRQN